MLLFVGRKLLIHLPATLNYLIAEFLGITRPHPHHHHPVPVEKVGADHQPSPALAGLAVHHRYILLVLLQPPGDQRVKNKGG